MSDYLFDKEGEPDPEIERLEQLLRPLAYQGPPARRRRARSLVISGGLLAACAVIALLTLKPWRPGTPAGASWAVSVRGGAATLDGRPITGEGELPVGAWLDTGSSRAVLRASDLGTVELEPGTRARIRESGSQQHTMQLERGALFAQIAAPPRHFLVETRHAVVVDLGCAFRIVIGASGLGQVVVEAGRVAVAASPGSAAPGSAAPGSAAQVIVPAGARCDVTAAGPGVPYLSDASPAFRAALARYATDGSALPAVLREARPQDRFTLRELLSRVPASERAQLAARLAELDGIDRSSLAPLKTPLMAPLTTPLKSPLKAPLKSRLKTSPTLKPGPGESGNQRPSGATKATPQAPKKASDAPKTKPAIKIDHDALKDLERSAP